MKNIKSVLLDNSFVTRLLKADDEYHLNAVAYFEYFLEQGTILYLSTIVVSEYAAADNPDNLLALNTFQLLEFDYGDAKTAGEFFSILRMEEDLRSSETRRVIVNDIKLFAQIHNRSIDGYISKDKKSLTKYINPLKELKGLNVEFIDLTVPLKEKLGRLF